MANAASQYNYKLAVDAGKKASADYLNQQQNPNSSAAKKTANSLAAGKFEKVFNDLEEKRKELEKPSQRDPNKPLIVYDPMNRLTNPVRIDKPAADYSSILNMPQYSESFESNLSPRGPITTPSVLPAHVQTLNAFMAYIASLDQQGLLDLKAHLFAYRDALKTQPASIARNTKIREAELQISKINQKLPESVRYGSPAVVKPPSSSASAQVDVARGPSVSSDVSSDTVSSQPVWKSPPTGITVSTMPVVDTGNEGVRAELNAPILDLYSVYADRGYEREAAAIQGETARLLEEIKQQQEYRVSVPQASPVKPVTSQPSQQQVVVATETDYTLQPMPTMPSPVETVSLEEAATGKVASGPVVMSAGAANVPEAVNWWLLGGLGLAALVFFGGKVWKGKK
jgi:hypothetical protein